MFTLSLFYPITTRRFFSRTQNDDKDDIDFEEAEDTAASVA
jgi:hypothetical protein